MPLTYMWASGRLDEWIDRWAAQMADLMTKHGGGNRRLAIERVGPRAPRALEALGLEVCDAADVVEPARAIKSPEEVLCINHAIAVAEDGIWRMRENLRPGMTELELWSHLWQANMEAGGDWTEGRLLSSGDRTNPWQQEACSRRIRAGDLVGFDTDMVGPIGYFADISRVFHCGPGTPTAPQ
jgi:Xaa-Pro aminopeptidase